ncbi:MAG: hypothetical protein HYU58_16315 [Proteobacteria bacterium]|nr:hypothetical protein [Pseudomonadota bacterium]
MKEEKPAWQAILEDFPLFPEPPKAESAVLAPGLLSREFGPTYNDWKRLCDAKLSALAYREKTYAHNLEIDWRGLALALARLHEPGFKTEPRKRRGRPNELNAEVAIEARKSLLGYVQRELRKRSVGGQQTAILKSLAGNPTKLGKIHPYYAAKSTCSLAKLKGDLSAAKKEDHSYRMLIAKALSGELFGSFGGYSASANIPTGGGALSFPTSKANEG